MPSTHSGPRWAAIAAAVWAAALAGVAVEAYLTPRGRTVFDIYAHAGRGWRDGDPDLYARQPDTREFFRYSPACAAALAPLAALPPGAGNALWKLANAAVFLAGLAAWCRYALPRPLTPGRTAAMFLLALPVAAGSLRVGQANMLVTGLVLFAAATAARDRWWAAAAYLAAAALVKVFPLALAGLFAVQFWRTIPVRFAATLAVGLAAPFACQAPGYAADQYGHWLRHLAASGELNRERLRSLSRLLEVLGLPVGPAEFLLAGAAAGLLVLGVVSWSAAHGAGRREVLLRAVAWYSVWAVLFVPSAECVTYAVLAPVSAWAVVESFGRPRAWASRTAAVVALVLVGPAVTDAVGSAARGWCDRNAAQAVGALVLAGWLAAELRRPVAGDAVGAVGAAGDGRRPAFGPPTARRGGDRTGDGAMTVRYEPGEGALYVGDRWLGTCVRPGWEPCMNPDESDPASVAEVLNAMCRHLGVGADRLLEFRGGAFGADVSQAGDTGRAEAYPFVCLDTDPTRPVLLVDHFRWAGGG
jgi:hypothetical protein